MILRLFLAFLLTISAQSALACACCAERGDRVHDSIDRGEFEDEEFSKLRALGPALVYLSACGMDCVKGLDQSRDSFDLGLTMMDGKLHLENSAGAMSLILTPEFTSFAVDTDPFSEGNMTMLYRELRFSGVLTASGVFSDTDGAKAEFVLAGESNQCWMIENLTHWRLDVSGDNAEFRLFGRLFGGVK